MRLNDRPLTGKLVAMQEDQAREAREQAAEARAALRRQAGFGAVVIAAVGLFTARLLSRSIVAPMARAVRVAEAVAASEVRALAQRSAAAAKEIKALIGDSGAKVEAGTRIAGSAGALTCAVPRQSATGGGRQGMGFGRLPSGPHALAASAGSAQVIGPGRVRPCGSPAARS